MKALVLIILLCLSSHAHAWDTTDTVLQAAVTGAIAADWIQTRDIIRHPEERYETNPLLGKYPHKDKVDIYFATCIIGHAAISYILPETARSIWQSVWIVLEVGQVSVNTRAGVKMEF